MSLKNILGTDLVKDSRVDINDNFTFLDNKIDNLDAEHTGENGQIQFNNDGELGGADITYGIFDDWLPSLQGNADGIAITSPAPNSEIWIIPNNSYESFIALSFGGVDIEGDFIFLNGPGSNRLRITDTIELRFNFYNRINLSDSGMSFTSPSFSFRSINQSANFNFDDISELQTFTFPNATGTVGTVITKDTTGDPSETIEGLFAINTIDNTFKVYANGGWRELANWA